MSALRPWSFSRGATRVTLAVTLAGIALVALVEPRIGGGAPPALPVFLAPPPFSGDTTVIYGPVQWNTPNGNPTNHTERFALSPVPGRRYLLRLTNGDGAGGHRVTGGAVQANGWQTVSDAELASGASIDRVIKVRSEDTLFATVQGSAGAYVTVSVLETADPTFLVLGPEHFVRTTGTPVTELRTFSIGPTAAPPYRLCLTNGDVNGANRVSSATIQLNGVNVFSQQNFNQQVSGMVAEVSLRQTANTLSVTLAGIPGGFVDICVTATDTTPPVIANIAPPQNFITKDTTVTMTGTVTDETATTVTVGGIATPLTNGGFSQVVGLHVEGHQGIHVVATDAAGHTTDSTRVIIRDTQAPVVTVTAPLDNTFRNNATLPVAGTVSDSTTVTLNVNGVPLTVTNGSFSGSVTLSEGVNQLVFTATDAAGNPQSVLRTVTLDTQNPVIAVTQPAENDTVTSSAVTVTGSITDATAVTLTINGNPVTLGQGNSFSQSVNLVLGLNTVTLVATDQAANDTTYQRHVFRKNPLPPDPATVASILNRAEVSTIGDATAFLYTGANPIQTGVVAGTINPVRAAVLRGRVLDKSFQPLGGAVVKVLNHPELGQTLSRDDGGYDLAVNGGSQLTVSYGLKGYLPAQRSVAVPWQDYTRLDDVILLRPDTVATVVDLNSATPPVARASVATDADGARQATIIFKPGNSATITTPGGTPQPISQLTVRATEFTIGDSGTLSMPGDLPPASQYTYAVQITADTQIAAGPGTTVTLAQPVPVYVENFLAVPVGTKVPVGLYNEAAGSWTPEPNGIALRVLGTDGNGRATIDITGDGAADPPSALAALGIDDYELVKLAGLYPAGSDLWRALAPTFEPLDLNFPFIFVGSTPTDGKVKAGCSSRQGDPIRCQLQAQTAFQQVGLVGSPFTLNYASDRTQGNAADRKLDITLTGATLPPQLIRVELEVDVAGQRFTGSFPTPTPNMTYAFSWDGKDLYGRLVQGTQPATVLIGYVFPVQYAAPANAVDAFGLPCAPSGTGSVCPFIAQGDVPARAERTLVQRIETSIGTLDATALGLGGFTLDVQNVYDPVGQVLYNGDGTRRATAALPPGIRTVAGKPGSGILRVVNHQPALNVGLTGSSGPMAAGPDGSIYFADGFQTLIQRLYHDTLTTIAGKFPNSSQCSGDNGPGLSAGITFITGLAVGPDGTIYFTDAASCGQIRKIDPSGTIRHVAGKLASSGFSGDGGLADTAKFSSPGALAVGPDGSLYVNDQGNNRIRRIAPDGIISTFAGNGLICGPQNSISTDATFNSLCGNGVIATSARVSGVLDIEMGRDGSLYLSYVGRVRRITPDGIIRTFAGSALANSAGDGGPATLAGVVNAWALASGPDGSIYVAQANNQTAGDTRIRRIASTGIITTFAGNGTNGFAGDGGPAAAARIGLNVRGMTVGADGNLYMEDYDNGRIRKVAGVLPGFGAGQTVVASRDGSDLYVFSPAGRPLVSLRQLSGDTIYKFTYDSAFRLTSVRDRYGLTTVVSRDADGKITGIVSPDGYRTSLAIGPNDQLQSVTDPSGNVAQMSYSVGLPTDATDPSGFQTTYSVDSLGRITKVADDGGGFIARSLTDSTLTYSTPEGSVATVQATRSVDNSLTQTGVLPSGSKMTSTTTTDGVTVARAPDRTVHRISYAPDPRFGSQVPLAQVVTTLPSGLQRTERRARSVQLSDPQNLFSLTSQTDSVIRNGRVWTQTYDRALRKLTSRTAAGRMRFTFFNPIGAVVRDSVPGFLSRQYGYDAGGRLLQVTEGTRTVQAFYGTDGLQDSVRDELGRITHLKYDSSGNLLQRVRPGADTVRWAYDSSENRTSVTPPGRPAHHFTYSLRRAVQSYQPPPVVGESSAVVWVYRPDGQVSAVQTSGFTATTTYDTRGRPSYTASGTDTIRATYDDSTGQIRSISGPANEVLNNTYDGMLVTQRAWTGSVAGIVSAQYDSAFRISTLSVNGSPSVLYGYDADGAITSAGSLTLSRDALTGLVTGSSIGQVTTTITRNNHAEDSIVTAQAGSTVLARFVYARDQSGRVAGVSETINGSTSSLTYAYDSTGRLTSVSQDGVTTASYEYDRNGNRTRAVYQSGEVLGTYDVQDRLLTYGAAQYQQSAAGNISVKIAGTDTTRYIFDAFGRLRSVQLPNGSTVAYIYDASGHRVGKSINGTLVQGFLYSGGNHPVAELDGNGVVVRQFVYASRPDVPDYVIQGSTVYRVIADAVGSVRLLVDTQSGAIVQQLTYDAFGRIVGNSSPNAQPFGFAGGIIDTETGLVQRGVRFYDPETGRWISRDPLLFEGGGSNLYTYAASDPINNADRSGALVIIVILEMEDEIEQQQKREMKRIENTIDYTAECINGMIDVWFDTKENGPAAAAAGCASNVLKAFAWNTVEDFIGAGRIKSPWLDVAYHCMFGLYEDAIYPDLASRLGGNGQDPDLNDNLIESAASCLGGAVGQGLELMALSRNRFYGPLVHAYSKILFHTSAKFAEALIESDSPKDEPQ